jgi:dihydropteroate synthase
MLLNLNKKGPLVMGIVNVTPDSFSDGGKNLNVDEAVSSSLEMISQGADIIDIGGESSGPGSVDVSEKEELERVLPVIQKLRSQTSVIISVDTYKSVVAKEAISAGADMVNDVTALRADDKMLRVLAENNVPVVLMYSKDATARTTRNDVQYEDVVTNVKDFLRERADYAIRGGINKENIILDPGSGAFIGMNPKYSLEIIERMNEFKELSYPLLYGPSRKSFIGQVLDLPLTERLEGTLAACAIAVYNGAKIVRVHDVLAARRIVDMVWAIKNYQLS